MKCYLLPKFQSNFPGGTRQVEQQFNFTIRYTGIFIHPNLLKTFDNLNIIDSIKLYKIETWVS